MKRCLLVIAIVVCVTSSTHAQQPPSSDKKNAQAVVTGLFDALSELNVDKARSFCANDIIILESGKIWNFDSLAIRIVTIKSQSLDFNRINKLDFIDNKIAGNIAWLSYYNQATIVSSGRTTNVKWLESAVLKKEKGQWKICLLHSTELERTP